LNRAYYASAAPVSKAMRQLLRLISQIALLRRGPEDLPGSTLLVALTVLGYAVINALIGAVLPEDTHWQVALLIDMLFTLLWYVALLRLARRPERTLQTLSAVFGVRALLSPLLLGAEWLVRRFTEDATWGVPVSCLFLLLWVWLIAASTHIVKAALEWSTSASIALVILEILASWLVLSALFPSAKS
jgi:hypothetical protein